jgi:polyhydroxybutyrate depolymerase
LFVTTFLFHAERAGAAVIVFPGVRPFNVIVPSSYDPNVPAPLLIALHGFSQSGDKFENYLHIRPIADKEGILYVHPDGTKDPRGTRFWNATPECCDYQTPLIDDDTYIMDIVKQVSLKYMVDPNRIYLVGHSNGGFMVNRMACRHADVFAAVVNMAGGSYVKTSTCKPSGPISILQIWGTKDVTYMANHYKGRTIPGAVQTFTNWAALNRCSRQTIVLPHQLDLDRKVPGLETVVTKSVGCPDNTAVEFWSITGAGHVPTISKDFTADLVQFLLEHPKDSANQGSGLG